MKGRHRSQQPGAKQATPAAATSQRSISAFFKQLPVASTDGGDDELDRTGVVALGQPRLGIAGPPDDGAARPAKRARLTLAAATPMAAPGMLSCDVDDGIIEIVSSQEDDHEQHPTGAAPSTRPPVTARHEHFNATFLRKGQGCAASPGPALDGAPGGSAAGTSGTAGSGPRGRLSAQGLRLHLQQRQQQQRPQQQQPLPDQAGSVVNAGARARAGQGHAPGSTATTASGGSAPEAPRGLRPSPPRLDPAARAAARLKLAQDYGRAAAVEPVAVTATADGTSAAAALQPAATAAAGGGPLKLTPLEQQVVALKAQHPGTLLIVEVGYKMRFFGEDAEVAAQVCGLWCHMDHNFLTASFPVYRTPLYVRRLCRAGHRVGVVRQSETASLKATSANKSAPFERKLAGLYTAATLEAAARADKIGEEGAVGEALQPQGLSGLMGDTAAAAPTNILFIAELLPAAAAAGAAGAAAGPRSMAGAAVETADTDDEDGAALEASSSGQQQQQQQHVGGGSMEAAASPAQQPGLAVHAGKGEAAAAAAAHALALGVLVVDVGSGEVVYGVCGDTKGAPVGPGRGRAVAAAAVADVASGLEALEALLLAAAPVELVAVGPLPLATRRLLANYLSAAPACRLERVALPQPASSEGAAATAARQRQGPGAGGKATPAPAGRGKAATSRGAVLDTPGGVPLPHDIGPRRGGRLRPQQEGAGAAAAAARARQLSDQAPPQDPSGGGGCSDGVVGAAVMDVVARDTTAALVIGGGNEAHAAWVARLPPCVLAAAWAALRHLQPLGMEGVLFVPTCWRPLSTGGTSAAAECSSTPEHAATGAGAAPRPPPVVVQREMQLGPNALRQLEVLAAGQGLLDEGSSSGSSAVQGSLLQLMDRTHTASGSRLLRRWLSRPLAQQQLIERRQQAVAELLDAAGGGGGGSRRTDGGGGGDGALLGRLPAALRGVAGVERSVTRALHGTAAPSEFVAALQALAKVPASLGLPQPLPDAPNLIGQGGHGEEGSGGPSAMEVDGPGGGSSGPAGHAAVAQLERQVASPLLRHLLRSAAGADLARRVLEALAPLDTAAAAANDFSRLFADQRRFPGVWQAQQAVLDAEAHLQGLLPGLAQALAAPGMPPPRLVYMSVQNQGSYLIEVAVEMEKRVPKPWSKVCSTKRCHRYQPPEVAQGLLALGVARERLAAAQAAGWAQHLAAFRSHYPAALAAVQALAELDALCSLAALAATPGYCRPRFVPPAPLQSLPHSTAHHPSSRSGTGTGEPSEGALLHVHGGRHPMLDARLAGTVALPGAAPLPVGGPVAVVPNDLLLGGAAAGAPGEGAEGAAEAVPRCLVVTGPNMGGKSCLIRTAALLVIMAQVGSYVPADAMELSVFDGVHTRMGASDNILLGRSTFLEEMADTSAILRCAGPHSLVIVDELGRGTATHDGVAVAGAVLAHLLAACRSVVLFVTHYPQIATLAGSFGGLARCCHMAYTTEPAEGPPCSEAEASRPGDGSSHAAGATDTEAAAMVASDDHGAATAVGVNAAEPEAALLQPGTPSSADSTFGDGAVLQPTGLHSGSAPSAPRALPPGRSAHGAAAAAAPPRVTFLYKLRDGAADESFGLNVARMAGLPHDVVARAHEVAAAMRAGMDGSERPQKLSRQQQLRGLQGAAPVEQLAPPHADGPLRVVRSVLEALSPLRKGAREDPSKSTSMGEAGPQLASMQLIMQLQARACTLGASQQ